MTQAVARGEGRWIAGAVVVGFPTDAVSCTSKSERHLA